MRLFCLRPLDPKRVVKSFSFIAPLTYFTDTVIIFPGFGVRRPAVPLVFIPERQPAVKGGVQRALHIPAVTFFFIPQRPPAVTECRQAVALQRRVLHELPQSSQDLLYLPIRFLGIGEAK